MGKSSTTKIIIIVVLLGAAGVILAVTNRSVPKVEIAKDAHPMDFICTQCKHEFQIPYDDYVKARDNPESMPEKSEEGPKIRRTAVAVVITCPKCNEKSAVLAIRCPKHKVMFPKILPDGTRGHCPQCPAR